MLETKVFIVKTFIPTYPTINGKAPIKMTDSDIIEAPSAFEALRRVLKFFYNSEPSRFGFDYETENLAVMQAGDYKFTVQEA
jgi:hypothetical protein